MENLRKNLYNAAIIFMWFGILMITPMYCIYHEMPPVVVIAVFCIEIIGVALVSVISSHSSEDIEE